MAQAKTRSRRKKRKSRSNWFAALFLELASLVGILAIARPNVLAELQGLHNSAPVAEEETPHSDHLGDSFKSPLAEEELSIATPKQRTAGPDLMPAQQLMGSTASAVGGFALDTNLQAIPGQAENEVLSTSLAPATSKLVVGRKQGLRNSMPASRLTRRSPLQRRIWPPPVSNAPTFHW